MKRELIRADFLEIDDNVEPLLIKVITSPKVSSYWEMHGLKEIDQRILDSAAWNLSSGFRQSGRTTYTCLAALVVAAHESYSPIVDHYCSAQKSTQGWRSVFDMIYEISYRLGIRSAFKIDSRKAILIGQEPEKKEKEAHILFKLMTEQYVTNIQLSIKSRSEGIEHLYAREKLFSGVDYWDPRKLN